MMAEYFTALFDIALWFVMAYQGLIASDDAIKKLSLSLQDSLIIEQMKIIVL
jgi:hypothetical protein